MKKFKRIFGVLAIVGAGLIAAFDELTARQHEKEMEKLNKRIDELEKEKTKKE